jgi:exonuclease III
MIGVIWNCQGLGKSVKSEFLRDVIMKEKVNFIGLQETNKKDFDESWLNFISGNKNFVWVWSPPNGRSGGLLVGFDSDMFDVREKELGEFMIRLLVIQKDSGFIWNFINVYGAAQNDQKQNFLSELSSFCSKCSHPLLIGGDFNILRRESDKNKPGGTNKWSALFNSIIDVHDLIELDLSGRHFTWSNNRNPPTFEKLDRFLVSPDWDLHYNNLNVTGLSRSFSDHVPLCLRTDFISPTRREFRYELGWRLRPDFKSLVVNNWSLPVRSKIGIDIWKEKVKRLKKLFKGWNINVEGRYLKLKKELMEKIDILDKKCEILGISDSERIEKLDMEWNLKKIMEEEICKKKTNC